MTEFSPSEVAAYYRARVPKLKQHGREWRGPCPVHNGKRESFAVDPKTGRAYCHSECGRGWDILGLEQELSGVDFKTAKADVFRLVGRVESGNGNCHRSESLDASNLMMPLVFFMSPSDPRMLKTPDALNQSPANGGLVSNSLVHRYNVEETADGLRGEEGTFNICTLAPRLSWYSPV